MTDYAISICNRIIIWNDDNHESEVYFNGEKAGYLGDELDCITTVAERAAAAGPKPTICKRVYIFDLCEVMDDEEENKEETPTKENKRTVSRGRPKKTEKN